MHVRARGRVKGGAQGVDQAVRHTKRKGKPHLVLQAYTKAYR